MVMDWGVASGLPILVDCEDGTVVAPELEVGHDALPSFLRASCMVRGRVDDSLLVSLLLVIV